jgi:glycosyltransferase involved in cell wall biosynthesis
VDGLTILYHHRTRARDGQSVHIDELIGALRAQGHRVVTVEPRRVGAMAETIERRLLPQFAYEFAELGYSILEFAKLAAAAIRYRPDALYERANIYMLSGVWAARLFRLPYILEVNAPIAEERTRYGKLSWPALAAWTERTCWHAASVVLPVTEALASYVIRAGVPEKRVVATPNGVDTDAFHPRDGRTARARLGWDESLVLGFVGYVREWHGLDRIIDLMAERPALRRARLLVVGDGPAREALERQARTHGLTERVHFTGVVGREALPDLVSAMDIALQPQVTPYASPLKLFEYMALGRTIVAPASGNIAEVLEDGVDALLFPPGDTDALAAAIERLAGDATLRDRLGAAAAKKIMARNLTWNGNAARVVSIIRSLRSRSVLAEAPA